MNIFHYNLVLTIYSLILLLIGTIAPQLAMSLKKGSLAIVILLQ